MEHLRNDVIESLSHIAPLNGWCFVKRDPDIEEKDGFIVGDEAKVKALTGTVVAGEMTGKRVQLPCQESYLEEMVIEGIELTAVKQDSLYTVLQDGAYRPINRYVRVRKAVNDHIRDEQENILLYRTDKAVEYTRWVEIIDYADDCRLFPKNCTGWMCYAPEKDDRLQRLGYTDDFFLHEELIPYIVKD